jgi:hypothetical protein
MAVGLGRLAKMLLGTDERLSAVLRFLRACRDAKRSKRDQISDLAVMMAPKCRKCFMAIARGAAEEFVSGKHSRRGGEERSSRLVHR